MYAESRGGLDVVFIILVRFFVFFPCLLLIDYSLTGKVSTTSLPTTPPTPQRNVSKAGEHPHPIDSRLRLIQ